MENIDDLSRNAIRGYKELKEKVAPHYPEMDKFHSDKTNPDYGLKVAGVLLRSC